MFLNFVYDLVFTWKSYELPIIKYSLERVLAAEAKTFSDDA